MVDAEEAGDYELAEKLNKKQRVMKENMNSWYGVLGSGQTEKTRQRPFRMTDPEIGWILRRLHDFTMIGTNTSFRRSSLWYSKDGVFTTG